ncbi:DUF4232 domain-containing protein [Spirillospora sp. CA-108201]
MGPGDLRAAADGAGWPLPDEVTLVAVEPDAPCVWTALDEDVLAELECPEPHLLLPGPFTAGRRAMLDEALPGRRIAVGPAMPVGQAADALRWARQALGLALDGVLAGPVTLCEENLMTLWLLSDPAPAEQLTRRRLGILDGMTPGRRDRLTETLRTWLVTRGTAAPPPPRSARRRPTARPPVRATIDIWDDLRVTVTKRTRLICVAGAALGTLGLGACDSSGAGSAAKSAEGPGTAAPARPGVPSVRGLPSSPPPPPCTPEGIAVSMNEPDAAMGLRAARIELRNCGRLPYRLNGYPALRVLDEKRQPFNVTTVRGTRQVKDAGPKPLTIRPGRTAEFVIVWRNTVTEADTVAVAGTYLEVRPAPGRPVVIVPADGPIDLGNTGRLEGTAWRLPAS